MTHAELLAVVRYDPETGVFTSRETGKVLGYPSNKPGDRVRVSVKG